MSASKKTELAKNLIKYRKKFGLTQDDVAKQINKTRSAYAYYERTVTPPLSILKKLADIFNISIDELSKIEDKQYNATSVNQPVFALSQAKNPTYKVGSGANTSISLDQLSQEEKILVSKYRILPLESRMILNQTIQNYLNEIEINK
ncbi:MAG: helix-turn-helix transcriptional regulator [Oscillospiraceae bacterium]|nr:helix-turn-helix transcriptional regulator [Oscillospiraceae bacterium]